jgi:hypothetical protein
MISAPQESLPMISWTCCKSYSKGEQVGKEPKKEMNLPQLFMYPCVFYTCLDFFVLGQNVVASNDFTLWKR